MTKFFKKYFFIILILALAVIFFVRLFNYIYDNKDACLDSGICKEGLAVKMNDGQKIIINQETCKQYNGVWRDKYNDCHFIPRVRF